MKVYVLYESLYGELQETGDSTLLIGIYDTLEKARNKANELIDVDLGDNYVLDNEATNGTENESGFWRLFWNNQENWRCYYEVVIECREVE